ncbi:glycosyltransferase [uncultured Cyclobacterium sp.]|uniref:glycosyltransferase n=1 Tax=uncultured Cyclobacterium sp. TaxID=453820 RepID=UPI0030EEB8BB
MNKSTVIAVFCYKRAAKLKASIEALLKNSECASLEVVFFCDGYKNEKDKQAVLETRSFIDSITGFKKVHKCFREKNMTTGPNFITAFNYLCNNFDEFIVVEDDIVVTPNFLKYMLEALTFYQDQESVFCVSGFSYAIHKGNYKYDSMVFKRFCSYGWASWSNRVKDVIWDKSGLISLMQSSPGFKRRLNSEGYDLYRMLKKQISGKISTWDIQMQVHVSESNLKVIYPVISKTKNIGFDVESTNTSGIDFTKTPQDNGQNFDFVFCSPEVIVPSLQRQMRRPFSLPQLTRRKILNTINDMLITKY